MKKKKGFFESISKELEVVAHTFNPSTWNGRVGDLCEFQASPVYVEKYRVRPSLENEKRNEIGKNRPVRGWGRGSVVEYLPSMCQALVSMRTQCVKAGLALGGGGGILL
jgi:hypothetical protein